MVVRIGRKDVGDGHPAFVVAEMAWAHNGSLDHGATIVDAAAAGGADAINFHLTDVAAYMVPDYGAGPGRVSAGHETHAIFEYLLKANLSFSAIATLAERARGQGLLVSAMCNDEPSRKFCTETIVPDLMMVHPSCVGEERFVRRIAASGIPIVLYIGGLKLGEIDAAIGWVRSEGNDNIILQHGFQSYPTAIEDNHLRYIATLKAMFGTPVSFGDHTDGGDPMAIVVPLLGVAAGANVVEKHLTFDRAAKGEDFESSLDPAHFKTMVERLRQTEAALGSAAVRPLSERELRYREVVRKRAVAAEPIARGEEISLERIAFRRSDHGLYPEDFPALCGRRACRDLAENDAITRDVFE